MAIDIDASSPAVVSNGGSSVTSVTTASFTPPSGSLLVAVVMATSGANPTVSGGSLTWTRRQQHVRDDFLYAELWTAPVASAAAMTTTLTVTGSFRVVALKVLVVTGQHATTPIGSGGAGQADTNAINPTGYTSTAAGSRGFFAAIQAGLGAPTTTDVGFAWTASNGLTAHGGVAAHKSSDTATSGTSVAFDADAPGSTATEWAWAALEILPPAATSAPPRSRRARLGALVQL